MRGRVERLHLLNAPTWRQCLCGGTCVLEQAVDPIKRHVDQEAQPDQMRHVRCRPETRPFRLSVQDERQRKQERIERDGGSGVQRVETDRAPLGIVDGVGDQVIEIHKHRRDHDQRGPPPVGSVESERDKQGYGEM